jgi:hypothetical protein
LIKFLGKRYKFLGKRYKFLYLTLHDRPYSETSDTATVAVSTRGVPLLI